MRKIIEIKYKNPKTDFILSYRTNKSSQAQDFCSRLADRSYVLVSLREVRAKACETAIGEEFQSINY